MAKKVEIEQKEIEAPYNLPEGWKWVRLGDCAKTISKGTTPEGGKDAYVENGINYLRIENLMDNGSIDLSNIAHITKEQHEGFLKRSILEAGDLLISIAGTLGRVGFVKESDLPMNTNQAIAFVRLHKDLFDNMYLKYAIESPFVNNELIAKTKVTSIPNLTLEIISNCLIPLPPTLAEQQRIVNRIENMFAKLDEAKEKARNAADSFETRRTAILHQAFTGSLTAKWRKENGVSDDSWKEKSLGEVVSGFKYGISDKCDYSNSGIAVLRIPNIANGFIEFDDLKFSERTEIEEAYIVKPNDILIIRSNGSRELVGKSAIFDDTTQKFSYGSFLIKITPSEIIDKKLLVTFLNSEDARYQMFNKAKSSSGIHNINSKELSAIRLNLPTLPEQQEIVRILDAVLEKERIAKSAAEQVLEQIALLKKSILSRAFRGEL